MKKIFFLLSLLILCPVVSRAYTQNWTNLSQEIDALNDQLGRIYSSGVDITTPEMEAKIKSIQDEITRKEKIVEQFRRIGVNESIWGKGRYTYFGYTASNVNLVDEGEVWDKYKGTWALSITKGTTYYFPKEPIGNIFKFGIDVNWIDFTFGQYKNKPIRRNNYWDGNDEGGYWDDNASTEDDKYWGIYFGIFGFGPNLSFAPFASINNELAYLKLSVFAHYVPTLGLTFNEGYEDKIPVKYNNVIDFGGKITWKNWGLGIEKQWGFGDFDDSKARYNNFRVFLALAF